MPDASPDVPPADWTLSPEGRSASRALLSRIPATAILVASTERKAWETLAEAGRRVGRDSQFVEVRHRERWEADPGERRRQYVGGVTHVGWEPHADAAARFDAGVKRHRETADARGAPLVVATHGMVLTTWMVATGAVATADAADFWASLRFPDCIQMEHDLPWRRLE